MISGNKLNGFLISFVAGGAIGGAIALLYAPKKGKHLRNDISRKTNDLIDQGKKLTYDSWSSAKEAAESTLESANDFLNTGMDKIAQKTEKVKDAIKTGFNAYNDVRHAKNDHNSLYDDDAEDADDNEDAKDTEDAENPEKPGRIEMQYNGRSNLDFSSIMLH